MEIIQKNNTRWRKRLLIATATEGWIRYEWAHARFGQIIPVNWEASGFDLNYTAIGYSIDDAYNIITQKALEMEMDWLITIEDDVLLPLDCFLKLSEYMKHEKYPVVSGLYYSKGVPSSPLLFRGRGNGCFEDWQFGDKVWCDGLPMGCLLIHTSILDWFWKNTETYKLPDGNVVNRVFQTPQRVFIDPETGVYARQSGTQDLFFFDRVLDNNVLEKTGWEKMAKEQYPFLCDTSIFCRHIDRATGRQYP